MRNYVASISSSTSSQSGDMMIYMGKNPKNFTADSEYQFAISKFIGQIGSSEMWKDMLKTKILASGLLSLMITGCVNPTDGVKQENLTAWQESNLLDLYAETSIIDDSIFSLTQSNGKYYILTKQGHLFYTEDFITFTEDTNFYDSTTSLLESYTYFSFMTFFNENFYTVIKNQKSSSSYQYTILSYDGNSATQLFSTDSTISQRQKGSYWKSKKILFIPICTSKSDDGIYTIKLYYNSGSVWNYIELESTSNNYIASYGICDDYVVGEFSEEYLKLWDGSSVISVKNPLYGDGSVTPVFISNFYNNDFLVKKGSAFYRVFYDESMNFYSEKIVEDDNILIDKTPMTAFSSNGIYFSNTNGDSPSSVLYFYNFKTKTVKQVYSRDFWNIKVFNNIVFCFTNIVSVTTSGTTYNYNLYYSKDNGETWETTGLENYTKTYNSGDTEYTSEYFFPNGTYYAENLNKYIVMGIYEGAFIPATFVSTTTELFSAVSTLQSNVSTVKFGTEIG